MYPSTPSTPPAPHPILIAYQTKHIRLDHSLLDNRTARLIKQGAQSLTKKMHNISCQQQHEEKKSQQR